MRHAPALPRRIAAIAVPQDDVSGATWRWANRSLPGYLLAHSVRSYCWGAELAEAERWTFDPQILWTASLMHDVGLTRIPSNSMCFDVEGAEIARSFLEREGLLVGRADRVAIAIILHMQPNVTLDDGVESVLLDRSTAVDVLGTEYDRIDRVRAGVMGEFPRGAFDRHFVDAIRREAVRRPGCHGARLLAGTGLADTMARSPWAAR